MPVRESYKNNNHEIGNLPSSKPKLEVKGKSAALI